jgi:predicted metal-binding membrane protein
MDVTPTSRCAAMTSTRTTALATTVGAAGACWLVAAQQMRGMDMGTETTLGSFPFFVGVWTSMMAAMMLPGAFSAVLDFTRAKPHAIAAPVFAASYVAVWTVFGLLVYAVYRPHGAWVAGALTIAAGVYELTPFKRSCRRRCRETVRSGFQFGAYCVGSSIGLMIVLVALGVMSLPWMAVIASLVLVQKLVPPQTLVDVPVALGFVALGVVVLPL